MRIHEAAVDRVANLGQVFTPPAVVDRMLALRQRKGRTLEPSCGDGAFLHQLPQGSVGIELDATVASPRALVMNFFDYPESERFDTVIGNPPYVGGISIEPATRASLSSSLLDMGRANLYLHFIEKCVRHLSPNGELIFICPRDFMKLTAARNLNTWLLEQGSFTHFEETGDSSIFGRYVPNCAIWRFEKDRTDHRLDDGRFVRSQHGQLMFVRAQYAFPMSALFDVKVGGVTGADDVFVHPEGNTEYVCSTTIDTGVTRPVFHGIYDHPHLLQNKPRLLARRIRRFSERNWWHWGREQAGGPGPRIYVNAKTRRREPFFLHPCELYDGSILALYPRFADMDLGRAAALLNQVDWEQLGFVCDGRHLFSQRSLQHVCLPGDFHILLPQRKAPHTDDLVCGAIGAMP